MLEINFQDFRQLQIRFPGWKDFYIKQLEAAFLNNQLRLEGFIRMNAKERYKYLLKYKPYYVQRLSNKTVASYLGITQESLSRVKSQK